MLEVLYILIKVSLGDDIGDRHVKKQELCKQTHSGIVHEQEVAAVQIQFVKCLGG